jgi:hypothetical protein
MITARNRSATMHAHKLDVDIPADRRISLELPDDFPAGPAEIIVLAARVPGRNVVRLGGVLQAALPRPEGHEIADALSELRRERSERLERSIDELLAENVDER